MMLSDIVTVWKHGHSSPAGTDDSIIQHKHSVKWKSAIGATLRVEHI